MDVKEIWKSVPNYEGIYEVSNLGRVRSLKFNKVNYLTPSINKVNKYSYTSLNKGGKSKTTSIHRLMAKVFLGLNESNSHLVVDHIDGDRSNNRLDNLDLVTQRENLSRSQTGDIHPIKKIIDEKGLSIKDLSERLNMSYGSLRNSISPKNSDKLRLFERSFLLGYELAKSKEGKK